MHKIKIFDVDLCLDDNALRFFQAAISHCPNPKLINLNLEDLSGVKVTWDGETTLELANGEKISEHNWDRKNDKINKFKQDFLKGDLTETCILVIKDTNYEETLIIDGIHRSVGYVRAVLEKAELSKSIKFKAIFFESDKIHEMYDYERLFVRN